MDGDERHLRLAEDILQKNNLKNIKIVTVTKNKSHKASKLTGEKEILENFKNEIILANAEAHRSSLSYHKLLRKKNFLK